jgi:hypothetical protein
MTKINLDKFFSDYNPQINHIMRNKTNPDIKDEDIAPWSGCMYETYGEELEYIHSFLNKSRHIWTIVDNDGELVLQAGYWLINRMGYIVTERPWETEDILVED